MNFKFSPPASASLNFNEFLWEFVRRKMKKMKKRKRTFKNSQSERETSQPPWIRTQDDDFVPQNPRTRRLYARNTPDAPFHTIHQLPTLYANTSNHWFDLNSFPMPLTSLLEKKSLWALLKLHSTFSSFKDYGEQILMTSSRWPNSDVTNLLWRHWHPRISTPMAVTPPKKTWCLKVRISFGYGGIIQSCWLPKN